MPLKDKTAYLKYQKRYYGENIEAHKWNMRCNLHNITKEQFFEMLTKQDSKCALCNKPFQGLFGKDLHVDHCHETDKIRGLLCMPCNVGLGMLGDNEEGLSKALRYVKGELA